MRVLGISGGNTLAMSYGRYETPLPAVSVISVPCIFITTSDLTSGSVFFVHWIIEREAGPLLEGERDPFLYLFPS